LRHLQRGKALAAMTCLDDSSGVALDGTGSFSSTTMHCASCLHKVPRNGRVTSAHQMVGAVRIHPDVRAVMPLMPEPIVPHDGTNTNDCERHAATRFLAKLRQDHPHRTCIVTEDSLSAHAPHIETLQADDLHAMLGVTEGDHALLCQQVQAAEHAGRVPSDERHERTAGLGHRLRFVGTHLKRDSVASVMYAEALNSAKSSVTLQSTDRHEIVGQKPAHLQVSL
jgi:hypothetical protein